MIFLDGEIREQRKYGPLDSNFTLNGFGFKFSLFWITFKFKRQISRSTFLLKLVFWCTFYDAFQISLDGF